MATYEKKKSEEVGTIQKKSVSGSAKNKCSNFAMSLDDKASFGSFVRNLEFFCMKKLVKVVGQIEKKY